MARSKRTPKGAGALGASAEPMGSDNYEGEFMNKVHGQEPRFVTFHNLSGDPIVVDANHIVSVSAVTEVRVARPLREKTEIHRVRESLEQVKAILGN